MVEVLRQIETRLRYETAEHVTAAKLSGGAGDPVGMRWKDITDDPTLATRFRDALERIERLCYAVYGSRPVSYSPFVDWPNRLHPRCLWQPEQRSRTWCGGYPPNCDEPAHQYWNYHEYGALGDNYQNNALRPMLPIRSRSGDWRGQMVDGTRSHDRTYFPVSRPDPAGIAVTSVTRSDGSQVDYEGRQTFDPVGIGYFGGAPNVNPDLVGHQAPRVYAHEVYFGAVTPQEPNARAVDDVEVAYTPSAALVDQLRAGGASLCYNGVWVQMVETTGVWKAKIPAQAHNALVRWYVRADFHVAGQPTVTRYEPGGAAAPTIGQQYTFRFFTHWNPYPRGLPELWSKCAKGTDRYTFGPDETIQAALINLARFILDYIGASYRHTPRNRATLPTCCFEIPIRFRWSGSAPWPHYVHGGKGSEIPGQINWVTPVHNRDVSGGSTLARMSWRGVEQLWRGKNNNPKYGPGASWLSIPHTVNLELFQWDGPDTCKVHWDGHDRGLQPGDVISRSHIEEIIAAVDYIVSAGLWTLRPIKRRVKTYEGCGVYTVAISPEPRPGTNGTFTDTTCGCCWFDMEGNCRPYEAPTAHDGYSQWEDCWSNHPRPEFPDEPGDPANKAPFGTCVVSTYRHLECGYQRGASTGSFLEQGVKCAGGPVECVAMRQLCGAWYTGVGDGGGYVWFESTNVDRYCWQNICTSVNCGWAAYVCGPQRCPDGPDALHGNANVKGRTRAECGGGPQSTGPSAGNCFGDTFSCAPRIESLHAGEHRIPFETMVEVVFEGGAKAWENYDCGMECEPTGGFLGCMQDGNVPEIPGLPGHRYWYADDGTPGAYFCRLGCWPDPGQESSDIVCGFGLSGIEACMGDNVWAALDLNVDGLAPYTSHEDYTAQPPSPMMPTLRDYVAAPDTSRYPLSLRWTSCPCRSWTGPASCDDSGGPL